VIAFQAVLRRGAICRGAGGAGPSWRWVSFALGPSDEQRSYMVMVSLAWTLKAWFALVLPEAGR
jgi:hypothetical protein